jgi:thioesterase domain-containing protein
VPIRETGSERTFFHIGGVALLRKIRDHLGADQPIFSISEQPFDDAHPLFTDMDSVVEYCVTGVRSVQPEGPYLLGGLCFGGFVALEVARTLRDEGEQVDMLFIVEAYVPGSVRPVGEGVAAEPNFGNAAKRYVDALRHNKTSYVVNTTRDKLRSLSWKAANWGTQKTGLALPKRFRNIVEANNHIADRYIPEPYDGPVVLVDVEERDERFVYPPNLGWDDYLTGDVTVHNVPGGHLTAYEEPHVGHLAGHLADELASHRPGPCP